jgi:hypothetical protein
VDARVVIHDAAEPSPRRSDRCVSDVDASGLQCAGKSSGSPSQDRHGEVVDACCVAAAFSARYSANEARGTSATVTTGSGEPAMTSVDFMSAGLRWLRSG